MCVLDAVVASWPKRLPADEFSADKIASLIEVLGRSMGCGGEEGEVAGLLTVVTSCSVLSPLSLESLCHLVRACTLSRFAPCSALAKQGDAVQCMYIVLGGSLLELCDVTFGIVPSVALKDENRRYNY
jgi:hypothetical protein